jgi:transposase
MMTALLLTAYASGIYSSRRIAKACEERTDFMMIVAGDVPDFRTVSDFRKRHLQALARLFVQVLKLAEKAGLVKLGHVALDGTKIKVNISRPNSDVAVWSVHDPRLCENPENSKTRRMIFL